MPTPRLLAAALAAFLALAAQAQPILTIGEILGRGGKRQIGRAHV